MFADDNQPVHSFPELSLAAWTGSWEDEENEEDTAPDETEHAAPDEPEQTEPDIGSPASHMDSEPVYSVDDIVNEGCFLERARLEAILERGGPRRT